VATPQLLALGTALRGWAFPAWQQGLTGIAQIHAGLGAWRATGAELLRSYFLALLAEAYSKAGQVKEGLNVLDEALATMHNTGECWWEAEVHRLRGELLLRQAVSKEGSQTALAATAMAIEADGEESGESSRLVEAETCFRQALAIAQRQQAKSLELRAALSLSALWQCQGKREAARGLLAGIYSWFTEGFNTADLKEAKALLDDLS
jgi:predicted ATPase